MPDSGSYQRVSKHDPILHSIEHVAILAIEGGWHRGVDGPPVLHDPLGVLDGAQRLAHIGELLLGGLSQLAACQLPHDALECTLPTTTDMLLKDLLIGCGYDAVDYEVLRIGCGASQ